MKRILTVFTSSLMLLTAASVTALPVFGVSPSTSKVVDDDGTAGVFEDGSPSCDDAFTPAQDARVFTTVQAALTAANPGDDVFVCPGTYNETLTITKTLNLSGPWAGISAKTCPTRTGQATIIGPGTSNPALTISADNVVVDGLRFANTPGGGIATSVANTGYSIKNNVLANNGTGIKFSSNSQTDTNIRHNCFRDNNNTAPGNGIKGVTAAGRTYIWDNTFMDHRVAAINFDGTDFEAFNVTRNTSRNDVSFAQLKSVAYFSLFSNSIAADEEISRPGSAIRFFGTANHVIAKLNRISSNHTNGVEVGDTASSASIERNTIKFVGNGINILSTTPGAAVVKGNMVRDVTGTGLAAGRAGDFTASPPVADVLATGNTFLNNRVRGVANLHCFDQSNGGTGTDGTDNTWTGNTMPALGTETPSGICS